MSGRSYYFLIGILASHFIDIEPFWLNVGILAICLVLSDLLVWAFGDELTAAGQWFCRRVHRQEQES